MTKVENIIATKVQEQTEKAAQTAGEVFVDTVANSAKGRIQYEVQNVKNDVNRQVSDFVYEDNRDAWLIAGAFALSLFSTAISLTCMGRVRSYSRSRYAPINLYLNHR